MHLKSQRYHWIAMAILLYVVLCQVQVFKHNASVYWYITVVTEICQQVAYRITFRLLY